MKLYFLKNCIILFNFLFIFTIYTSQELTIIIPTQTEINNAYITIKKKHIYNNYIRKSIYVISFLITGYCAYKLLHDNYTISLLQAPKENLQLLNTDTIIESQKNIERKLQLILDTIHQESATQNHKNTAELIKLTIKGPINWLQSLSQLSIVQGSALITSSMFISHLVTYCGNKLNAIKNNIFYESNLKWFITTQTRFHQLIEEMQKSAEMLALSTHEIDKNHYKQTTITATNEFIQQEILIIGFMKYQTNNNTENTLSQNIAMQNHAHYSLHILINFAQSMQNMCDDINQHSKLPLFIQQNIDLLLAEQKSFTIYEYMNEYTKLIDHFKKV